MTIDFHLLQFPMVAGLAPQEIEYLPYGTRTLKIKVSNPGNEPENLVLRSANQPTNFGKDVFYTHEQDGKDFRLSWGGGHEEGACVLGKDKEVLSKKFPFEECVSLPAGADSFVYLNLTHTVNSFNPGKAYNLLLTLHPHGSPPSTPAKYELRIKLKPPQVSDPVRLAPENDEPTIWRVSGSQVPTYLPRWWSPAGVVYPQDTPRPPDLKLQFGDKDLEFAIRTNPGQEPPDFKPLACIRDNVIGQNIGNSEARFFGGELYHFCGDYFVLRLWFFWLQKAGLKTIVAEIPDSERFDLVIDPREHRVRYVATDAHWREVWARPQEFEKTVEARLGLFSNDVLKNMFGSIVPRKRYETFVDWLRHSGQEEDGEPKPIRRPSDKICKNLLAGDVQAAKDLGPGVECHVPYFVNCQPPSFISTDPKLG